jgi:hypothetical protein
VAQRGWAAKQSTARFLTDAKRKPDNWRLAASRRVDAADAAIRVKGAMAYDDCLGIYRGEPADGCEPSLPAGSVRLHKKRMCFVNRVVGDQQAKRRDMQRGRVAGVCVTVTRNLVPWRPKPCWLAPFSDARRKAVWRRNRQCSPAAGPGKRLLGSRCSFSRRRKLHGSPWRA